MLQDTEVAGGNTEPPALVRYAQNNGEEIVQSHGDCEIENEVRQIVKSTGVILNILYQIGEKVSIRIF